MHEDLLPFSVTRVAEPHVYRVFGGEREARVELPDDSQRTCDALLMAIWRVREGEKNPLDAGDARRALSAVIAGVSRVGPEDVALTRAWLMAHPEPRPVWVPMDRVEPTHVQWLWPGRIALGKVTMIAGDPGLGKSFLTLDMAARVSTGTPWPDCPEIANQPGAVVLLNCEDDLNDTIRPRLDRAGANCSRITALCGVREVNCSSGTTRDRALSLDRDLAHLQTVIARMPGCRLVVIDPITAYLGKVDSHNNAEIRALLAPLAEMAATHHVAVVCVSHLNKSAGPAMYRTMGSLAFVAAARAAWAVARDKDNPARRLVLPVKNNLGRDDTGMAYRIVDDRVQWESEPIRMTAEEALGAPCEGTPGPKPEARTNAAEWLRELLADGPMSKQDVLAEAEECGINDTTLNRAKRKAGVVSFRKAVPGPWYWRLPGPACNLDDLDHVATPAVDNGSITT